MSYIQYSTSENAVYVLKSQNKLSEKTKVAKHDDNIQYITENDEFIGVKMPNFYTQFENKGRMAENEFKNLLERNKIPFLYIGQNPVGIDYSKVIKNDKMAKRPDFLIGIPNTSNLFIDVKNIAKTKRFIEEPEHCHSIYRSEIEKLNRLQDLFLIPVWIAFYNESTNGLPSFDLIPIKNLFEFMRKITDCLSEIYGSSKSSYRPKETIRIPKDIMIHVENELSFNANRKEISQNLIDYYANQHKLLYDYIRKTVLAFVSSQNCYKSTLGSKILELIGKDLCNIAEINIVMNKLIEDGKILYEKFCPLRVKK